MVKTTTEEDERNQDRREDGRRLRGGHEEGNKGLVKRNERPVRSSHLTCLTVCVVRADELGRIRQGGDQEQHQWLQIRGEFRRDGPAAAREEGMQVEREVNLCAGQRETCKEV